MPESYDFSGIATAYDVLCGDGRIIKNGAFNHQDGERVPVVWRHGHKDIRNFLGHGLLAVNPAPSGMRSKVTFNNTKEGQRSKHLVHNKDIRHLSIWANNLVEHEEVRDGKKVLVVESGTIREVSLVMAGQNPGAVIDDVIIHSDDPFNEEEVKDGIIIHTEFEIEFPEEDLEEDPEGEKEPALSHEDDPTIGDIVETLNAEQRALFNVILHSAATGVKPKPSAPASDSGDGPTVKEVFETLSEQQKTVLHYMAGELSQEENLSQEGESDMPATFNLFESEQEKKKEVHLAHERFQKAMATAAQARPTSLREFFRQNDIGIDDIHILSQEEPGFLAHSITNISNFFPNAKAVDPGSPQFYGREMTWVPRVLNSVRRVPWSRLKSSYADLTAAAARAKGYVTGAQKVEEVIVALQRETTPTTVYKLQKIDRDNLLDITEFDVVVWLKAEMKMMLQEEVARAILISDGRSAGADKIVETNVRPIYNDDATYTISRIQDLVASADTFANFTAAEFIALVDYIAESFDDYRGAGNPVMFMQQSLLTKLMTVRDADNHRLHVNRADLADQLGVSEVIPVPVMNGMNRTGEVNPPGLPAGTYDIETLGVIVNLRDYAVGQDRGGETNFFDDFDIDYNKFTYLYETRMSGALVNPKSAICIENVVQKTA